MDDQAYDIAMKFVLQGGGTIWAESAMSVVPGDPLMTDFQPISSYDDYSNFFELQSFDFSMAVQPQDAAKTAPGSGATPAGRGPAPAAAAAGAKPKGASDPFNRWRSATEAEARKIKFQLTFDSFSFTRIIDAASPIFFQNCCQQKRFESAALIKRVSTGISGAGDSKAMAFMRMDFKDILLKSIKWSDGDLVTETCDFVCNWMSYQYRQQMPDGTLLPPQEKAIWDRAKDSERNTDGES